MTKITPLDITAYHTEGTRFIALGDKINELVAALNSREEKKDPWKQRCQGCNNLVGLSHAQGCPIAGISVCVLIGQCSPKEPTVKEECKCECHQTREPGHCYTCGHEDCLPPLPEQREELNQQQNSLESLLYDPNEISWETARRKTNQILAKWNLTPKIIKYPN